MLIFNGKKYFVPFVSGGSGENVSNCKAVVSNHCSNGAVDVYAQQFWGEFPNHHYIPKNSTRNVDVVNEIAMYIIRDGVIVPNYNANECKFDSWDDFMFCITNADNTKIKLYDNDLSDVGAGLHRMNTDVITSPLDFDGTVDIDEWNEALANIPFCFGGVPEFGTKISDTSTYSHIAFSIEGDTFYIRDVDNDVVICTVVDGVPNWTENYYSIWFIPSYSAHQGAPISFISWLSNNVVSSEYYYDFSNKVLTFHSKPTFESWYEAGAIRIPFTDQYGNEAADIYYNPDYGYTDYNGVHIFNDGQILVGLYPIYQFRDGFGLYTDMVITFGDSIYVFMDDGNYEWLWNNASLVPKDEYN